MSKRTIIDQSGSSLIPRSSDILWEHFVRIYSIHSFAKTNYLHCRDKTVFIYYLSGYNHDNILSFVKYFLLNRIFLSAIHCSTLPHYLSGFHILPFVKKYFLWNTIFHLQFITLPFPWIWSHPYWTAAKQAGLPSFNDTDHPLCEDCWYYKLVMDQWSSLKLIVKPYKSHKII